MIGSRALRNLSAAGLGAAMLASSALFALSAEPASALTNCTVPDSAVALDSEETRFLQLINDYRAQNGLGALTISTNLNRAAAWMVQDLGEKAYFSHTDSLGRSPSTRAQDCGYPGGAGENLAAGTVRDTAQEAFDAWKASSGHNANMLNSSYKVIGIARTYVSGSPYGWYWGTSFGLVNDGTSGGGNTGGTTTPPPPTQTPAPSIAKASLTNPVPGSSLAGTTATFNWDTGSGAREYFLYVGTAPGSNNIIGRSTGLSRSLTVQALPTNGSTLYVRLWTRFDAGWGYTDYTYRSATVAANTSAPEVTTTPSTGNTWYDASRRYRWR
ncbi:MAG: CAP domain-containing protein [Dehalococcoidia bacterium]|nr:CAP domain-containing protein [Dehalococcoidia bacterium]